ncbi:MAG: site-2 protease family protein [Planctomycetes bacterium]|nr:site-2 protease family protein [Planctomycetota bacterium]
MSWHDRDGPADDDPMRRFGRPGGDWQGLRPTLDNPMTWSVPAGRLLGIAVRVHVIFLVFIVIELLRAASASAALGFGPMALAMVCLFGIVLFHEFGHCLACRWAGGEADEILMWPLGGLAYCRPPHHWKAHLITVIGGPMVNVVICFSAATMLGFITGVWWGVAVPNPLSIGAGLSHPEIARSWAHMTLFWINALSLVLLLFNLLPIFPLDGGRIVQAALWPRIGYARSMRFTVRVGYVGAIALGVTGFVMPSVMLVMIAVFGGITCYITHKQLEFTEQFMGGEFDLFAASVDQGEPANVEPARLSRRQRRVERRALRQQQESGQVDQILHKIAESGMESLSAAEKRLLKRATQRKRQER